MPRKAKRKSSFNKNNDSTRDTLPENKQTNDVNGPSVSQENKQNTQPPNALEDDNDTIMNNGTDIGHDCAGKLIDVHITRLFDHIRYSEEAVSVLPNRSWAIHCTDLPMKRIVVSEMVMQNFHGRGLEPFYTKQIVFDERLNFEMFLLNSKTVLKDKPSSVGTMADFESVLDYVESLKLCTGGPNISQYSDISPECAYKDPYNKWRHNLCMLEVHDCDICESCASLEDILKRHSQRVKSPLKLRNNMVVSKRKRR